MQYCATKYSDEKKTLNRTELYHKTTYTVSYWEIDMIGKHRAPSPVTWINWQVVIVMVATKPA